MVHVQPASGNRAELADINQMSSEQGARRRGSKIDWHRTQEYTEPAQSIQNSGATVLLRQKLSLCSDETGEVSTSNA
jgi:hypothetical protein